MKKNICMILSTLLLLSMLCACSESASEAVDTSTDATTDTSVSEAVDTSADTEEEAVVESEEDVAVETEEDAEAAALADAIAAGVMYYYTTQGVVYRMDEFDENGNPAFETYYTEEGEVSWYEINEFDENGNVTKCNEYDADGEMVDFYTAVYDEDTGVVLTKQYFTPAGEASFVMTYSYDGDAVSSTSVSATSSSYSEYNEDGNVVFFEMYDGQTLISYTVSEYNEAGFLTSATRYTAEDVAEVTYYYNENGDLIDRTYF